MDKELNEFLLGRLNALESHWSDVTRRMRETQSWLDRARESLEDVDRERAQLLVVLQTLHGAKANSTTIDHIARATRGHEGHSYEFREMMDKLRAEKVPA